jgi:hypothetical protein
MTKKTVVQIDQCADIDAEARALSARGYKIMLDSREMFTSTFMDAEDAGEVERDSLGFTWYLMTSEEIENRALMLMQLAQVWINA